ncbi:MAG TPA: DoxX family protein [Polyangiales bacterium]|nr:DoxX family protein [Polyangiales bacterium]
MSSRHVTHIVRYALGAGFLLFGLNGFLHFLPQPPAPPAAMQFAAALFATGYMFPLIKGTEIIAAALLLSNRWVPLALALLAPVLVNILAFHAFLAPAGLAVPFVFVAAELYLAWSYRDAFVPMLRARVEPSPTTDPRVATRTAGAAA